MFGVYYFLRRHALPVAVLAAVGLALLVVVSASGDYESLEAESASVTGNLVYVNDSNASEGRSIEFGYQAVECVDFTATVLDGRVDFAVFATRPLTELIIDYDDPLRGVETVNPQDSFYFTSHTYPSVLHARTFTAQVTVGDGVNRVSCPAQTFAIQPHPLLRTLTLVNPEPFRPGIEQASNLQGVTDTLNSFLLEFRRLGQQLGAPGRVITKAVHTNPEWGSSEGNRELTNTPGDLNRYKQAANAFMDSLSHIPVRMFNEINMTEYYFVSDLGLTGQVGGAVTTSYTDSRRGTPESRAWIIMSLLDFKSNETYDLAGTGRAPYNIFKGIIAHETGHGWDSRLGINNLSGSTQEPAFLQSWLASNPGGSGFTYGVDPASLPQVTYDGSSYPGGFLRESSTINLSEDIAITFGSIFADDLAAFSSSRSSFDGVLGRSEIDPQLRNKLSLITDVIRRYEPSFSLEVARELNYAYGCLGCSPRALQAGELVVNQNDCLDVVNGFFIPGTRIQSFACAGVNAQYWEINEVNPQMIVGYAGHCLSVEGDVLAPGSLLQIDTCTGRPGQLWEATTNAELRVVGTDLCLSAFRAANTFVSLQDCQAAIDQRWAFRQN